VEEEEEEEDDRRWRMEDEGWRMEDEGREVFHPLRGRAIVDTGTIGVCTLCM